MGGLSSLIPPSLTGFQNVAISGRLAGLCPIARSRNPGHGDGADSCPVPGIHSELEEEHSAALSTCITPQRLESLEKELSYFTDRLVIKGGHCTALLVVSGVATF